MTEPTLATASVSNAFPLLADEEAHGDRQATEALLFTFNADLGFFESRLLGLLRATGARVTVIGDAGMWEPDTRAIQHAGRSYHFGLCESRAAFHPKLMVVAGPQRAIATVGSGNLTMGGWQYNSELLTAFRGDTEGMPTAFGDVQRLLTSLVTMQDLDPLATEAVKRTVAVLEGLIDSAPAIDTGHRIHASWDGSLIEALLSEPVAELYLSAAFHDPAASAVRRILDRLRPGHVQIAVQPGWTHIDPEALRRVLERHAESTGGTWELLRDPQSEGESGRRYRHGKLIEWVTTDGDRHALTGSPNLSHRALLADVASGGNHEIAVVGAIAQSLFPGGTPIAFADIPTLLVEDEAAASDAAIGGDSSVRVMAARTKNGETVEVHLNRAPDGTIAVELSFHSDSPDEWSTLGEIPPGSRNHVFDAAAPAGSRIRALVTGPDGVPEATAPVYVTGDSVLLRSAPTKQTSRSHRAAAADLFGDDIALLDSLQGDLANFAKDLDHARKPTVGREDMPERESAPDRSRGSDNAEPWLWLQGEALARFGGGIASWLLALPRLQGSGDVAEVPWLDKINDETEVGLEDEDTESATEEVLETEPEPEDAEAIDHRADPAKLKAARRKWVTRAVAFAPDVSPLSRLLVLRLALAFWSAGNWEDRDIEPFGLVRDLVRTLASGERQADELQERIGAVTAVALTVMRQRMDPTTHDERSLRYREAAELGSALLADMSEEAIEAYATGLRTPNGGALTVGHVEEAIADLTSSDLLRRCRLTWKSWGTR